MARPIRKGLAYFPLDSDFLSDRKIQRLLQNHGHTGICTYLTLLCEIYSTNGYYHPYTEDLCLDIAFTLQIHEKKVNEILLYCTGIRLFDPVMFERQQILTSVSIQSRYKQTDKRKQRKMHPAYILLHKCETNTAETTGSPTETPTSPAKTPQTPTKTPTKGKGKEEGKGNKEKNNQKKKLTNEKQLDEDALRSDELKRLAAIAAANSPDA